MISNIQRRTLDLILKASLVIATIGIISLIIRDYPNLLEFKLIIQYLLYFLLVLTVFFKGKIGFHIKTNVINWSFLFLMIVGLIHEGIQASTKVFIILIPAVMSFLYPYKKTILIFVLYIIVFLSIGFLITNSVIENPNIDVGFKDWFSEAILLILGGYILLFVGNRYRTKLANSLVDLQSKNKELTKHRNNLELIIKKRTKDLEDTIEKLKKTQLQLIQTEKMSSLGTLAAGIAHEINNPLNFIVGGITILEMNMSESYEKNDNEIQDALKMIKEGTERSANIVKALMSYTGKVESIQEGVNVNVIIKQAISILKHEISEDIIIDSNYDDSFSIDCFPGQLLQAFMSILHNAIFALNHNLNKNKLIKIETLNKQKYWLIIISNTGPQIPESIINQVFDPFFTTKDPGQGTGLGLSTCYNIITEHKGFVEINNIENGVECKISLPKSL